MLWADIKGKSEECIVPFFVPSLICMRKRYRR